MADVVFIVFVVCRRCVREQTPMMEQGLHRRYAVVASAAEILKVGRVYADVAVASFTRITFFTNVVYLVVFFVDDWQGPKTHVRWQYAPWRSRSIIATVFLESSVVLVAVIIAPERCWKRRKQGLLELVAEHFAFLSIWLH